MKSSEIIRILEKDGWYWIKTVGSHHHFKHPTKPGKVTVKHPKKAFRRKHLETSCNRRG